MCTCEDGTCRSCRLELRQLDKVMGTERTYIRGRLPSRAENEAKRSVIGNGLLASDGQRGARLKPPPAPRGTGISREERRKNTAAERREERDPVLVVIDGKEEIRMVSRYCPIHGSYSGYANWFCRCGHCTIAYSEHMAERRRFVH